MTEVFKFKSHTLGKYPTMSIFRLREIEKEYANGTECLLELHKCPDDKNTVKILPFNNISNWECLVEDNDFYVKSSKYDYLLGE